MPEVTGKEIPGIITKQATDWMRLQQFWFLLHYACGLAGVVAAVLASKFGWWLWGVIAAVSTAIVTFLGPLQKGDSYKNAYFRLASAIARFETVPSVEAEWLLAEHRVAQQMVLNQDPKPVTPAPR